MPDPYLSFREFDDFRDEQRSANQQQRESLDRIEGYIREQNGRVGRGETAVEVLKATSGKPSRRYAPHMSIGAVLVALAEAFRHWVMKP